MKNKTENEEITKVVENFDIYYAWWQSWAKWNFSNYLEKVQSGEIQIDPKFSENSQIYTENFSKNWYSVSPETMSFSTPTKTIAITEKEAQILTNNPEAQKNMVHFYENLEKTGLESLWESRTDILNSLASSQWTDFDYQSDGDFLSEKEMMTFFNAVLTSIWEETIDENLGLDDMISEITQKNERQAGVGTTAKNVFWRSSIEQKFYEMYQVKDNGEPYTSFPVTKFLNNLSENNVTKNEKEKNV